MDHTQILADEAAAGVQRITLDRPERISPLSSKPPRKNQPEPDATRGEAARA